MTVESQTTKVTGNGNGSATVFSFSPLVIFASSELVVTHVSTTGVETLLVEGTGPTKYSVAPATSFPGVGSVTYPADQVTPIPSGESVVIKRKLTLEQQTALENQGGYFADVQEVQFDKLLMIDLQQQEEIDRSLKLPVSASAAVQLPKPVANAVLGIWNATADDIVAGPTADQISGAAASATAAAASATAAADAFRSILTITGDTTLTDTTHNGKYLRYTGTGGGHTITIPLNSAQPFAVGTEIDVFHAGDTNTLAIAATTGVTVNGVNGGSVTLSQYTSFTIKKVATDEWDYIGHASDAW